MAETERLLELQSNLRAENLYAYGDTDFVGVFTDFDTAGVPHSEIIITTLPDADDEFLIAYYRGGFDLLNAQRETCVPFDEVVPTVMKWIA